MLMNGGWRLNLFAGWRRILGVFSIAKSYALLWFMMTIVCHYEFFFSFKVDYVLMKLSYDTLDTHDDAHPVMVFYARAVPHGPHD